MVVGAGDSYNLKQEIAKIDEYNNSNKPEPVDNIRILKMYDLNHKVVAMSVVRNGQIEGRSFKGGRGAFSPGTWKLASDRQYGLRTPNVRGS